MNRREFLKWVGVTGVVLASSFNGTPNHHAAFDPRDSQSNALLSSELMSPSVRMGPHGQRVLADMKAVLTVHMHTIIPPRYRKQVEWQQRYMDYGNRPGLIWRYIPEVA